MNKIVLIFATCSILWSCQSKYPGVPEAYHTLLDSAFVKAGENAIEIQKALNETPKEQK